MATSKKTQRKSSGTGSKRAQTGRIRVRREQSERRVAGNAHTAELRQRINDAIKEGQQLRRDIEAKIDRGLRTRERRRRGARR